MKIISIINRYFFLILLNNPLIAIADSHDQLTNNSPVITYEDMKLSLDSDENDTSMSLLKACPDFFWGTEIKDEIYRSTADSAVIIPMLRNINKNQLVATKNISILISGNDRLSQDPFSETYKMICLNHLIFAYARDISAYRFLHTNLFKNELVGLPSDWLKVIAMKTLLPQIDDDQWIMWADDDVITSDFHRYSSSFIDKLIDSYTGEDVLDKPSVLVSNDLYTGVNTGIVLVRNSEEGREFLDQWWDIRMDNINLNNIHHSNKSSNSYDNMNACLNAHGGCMTYDFSDRPNFKLKSPISAQETLERILFLPNTENFRTTKAAKLYEDTHIIKIFSQKQKIYPQDKIDYIGINTYLIDQDAAIEAINPIEDVWVHPQGFEDNSDEKNSYLISWLSNLNNLYPYHNSFNKPNEDFDKAWNNESISTGLASFSGQNHFIKTYHPIITYDDIKLSFSNDEKKLLTSFLKACPDLLSEHQAKVKISKNIVYPMITVPMPGNIKQNSLVSTKNIALLISGNHQNPVGLFPEIQKIICLNHLAFAYSRSVPAYRFLHNDLFKKQLANLPDDWLKVIAMRTLLPQIEEDKWIMWIDDDVVTSDFHEKENALIDNLIDTYANEKLSKRASVLVSEDPFTGVSAGIILVRNSKEGKKFLERWWKLRMDNINTNNIYYSHKTDKYYDDVDLCLDASYGNGGSDCNTRRRKSMHYAQRSSPLDSQKTLRHILFPYDTENIKTAKTAMLYVDSHVVKIFPQKHPLTQNDKAEENTEYTGINTLITDKDIPEKAKAINPDQDVWVRTMNMEDQPDLKSIYLFNWLSRISDLYPFERKGYGWQK